MPTGDFDPTQQVVAPVGAPAPETESVEEFLSPEEIAERSREEQFGEAGAGGELKKSPDVFMVPVKGRLNTAMRYANTVNSYLNRVTEVAKDVVTKFFGGPEVLAWVLRPTTKDRQILAAILKDVELPPEQFQQLVEVARDLELDSASLAQLKESMAGPNNLLIQFTEVVGEKNDRTVTVLREMLVLKPDKSVAEEYIKWANELIAVQEHVLGGAKGAGPGRSFNLSLSIEQMEALAGSIDTLKQKVEEKRKRMEKTQNKLISYLMDAGIKVSSSLIVQAAPAAVMERTRIALGTAAMNEISSYASALMDLQADVSFVITQATRWRQVVERTNTMLQELSDASDRFVASIQPTLT